MGAKASFLAFKDLFQTKQCPQIDLFALEGLLGPTVYQRRALLAATSGLLALPSSVLSRKHLARCAALDNDSNFKKE